jgi:hypothetical protein
VTPGTPPGTQRQRASGPGARPTIPTDARSSMLDARSPPTKDVVGPHPTVGGLEVARAATSGVCSQATRHLRQTGVPPTAIHAVDSSAQSFSVFLRYS